VLRNHPLGGCGRATPFSLGLGLVSSVGSSDPVPRHLGACEGCLRRPPILYTLLCLHHSSSSLSAGRICAPRPRARVQAALSSDNLVGLV
jgi:hypothetical protein